MAYCLINKSNYFHNLSLIEKQINKSKIALVLKNNAYGHGLLEIANLAIQYGIKHAVVNNISEANQIKNLFESILILQDIPKGKIKENLIISINSIESIFSLREDTKVELKIDTGMNRNGIIINEIDLALKLIKEKNLILNGVFTHFSSAFINDNSMYYQKKRFDELKGKIQSDSSFKNKIRFHCCASSSLLRIDNNEYDLARIGIMSYGYISLPDTIEKPYLKPVMSLWANKISSKSINKGESVGYGAKFIADKKMIISTYDIGYGDGFIRLTEKKRSNIEDGRNILGIVSMNSFSTLGKDEKVCVFENAERFSDIHGTIVYEIISNINPNFKRIVE